MRPPDDGLKKGHFPTGRIKSTTSGSSSLGTRSTTAHLRLDVLGAIGVAQCVPWLLKMETGWRDVSDHHRFAVPAQGIFEQASEFAIPVIHVAIGGCAVGWNMRNWQNLNQLRKNTKQYLSFNVKPLTESSRKSNTWGVAVLIPTHTRQAYIGQDQGLRCLRSWDNSNLCRDLEFKKESGKEVVNFFVMMSFISVAGFYYFSFSSLQVRQTSNNLVEAFVAHRCCLDYRCMKLLGVWCYEWLTEISLSFTFQFCPLVYFLSISTSNFFAF